MKVGALKIPKSLVSLIDAGVWPKSELESSRQHLNRIVPDVFVRKFAPEECMLYLYPPPFYTIASMVMHRSALTSRQCAVSDIDPELAVVIGDFGIGSDTVLALDYRNIGSEPEVIRLVWRLPAQENCWVPVAESFTTFWLQIGGE